MIGNSRGSCKGGRVVIKALGDAAWLVEFPGLAGEAALARVMGWVHALALDRPEGVVDVVPSFASVAVHFDGVDPAMILEWLRSLRVEDVMPEGREWEVPVCYGGEAGPDLAEVAAELDMSVAEVMSWHSGASYTVAAVGFSPGFPYLLGLPERLHLPRRRTPRAVPAGSVAMAGGQAGIYPFASPGGWHVLGRTDVKLFDPVAAGGALLKVGDRVRFVPVERLGLMDESVMAEPAAGERWLRVISPGSVTSVQDLGRPGHEAGGVSPGGAVDRQALRLANMLVGNAPGAAALECCLSGPILQFNVDTVVAVAGAVGKSREVTAGEVVDFSRAFGGVRGYLAVAGGLVVPEVLGSAATDVRAGFGGFSGRLLRAGDEVGMGVAGVIPRCGEWSAGRLENRGEIELRFLAGVQADWFSEGARWRLRHESYQLTASADRMGARLSGPVLDLGSVREMVSQPVVCGSVQVPPDGQPIVLLAERQTIGGYPQIGHVIAADLPKLARAWPGVRVRFKEISWEEARRVRFLTDQRWIRLQTGLKLL